MAKNLADQKSATKDIKENGRLVTLLSPKTVAIDPYSYDRDYSTGNPSSDDNYDETQISILQTSFDSEVIDGQKIRSTDLKFLASGALTISSNHKIRDGNKEFVIMDIETVKPADTIILYKIQVR